MISTRLQWVRVMLQIQGLIVDQQELVSKKNGKGNQHWQALITHNRSFFGYGHHVQRLSHRRCDGDLTPWHCLCFQSSVFSKPQPNQCQAEGPSIQFYSTKVQLTSLSLFLTKLPTCWTCFIKIKICWWTYSSQIGRIACLPPTLSQSKRYILSASHEMAPGKMAIGRMAAISFAPSPLGCSLIGQKHAAMKRVSVF